VFSKKTIEGAFWHLKELGNVLFDGNVIINCASKAKVFDEFDGIYVIVLGGLLDIGGEAAGLFDSRL